MFKYILTKMFTMELFAIVINLRHTKHLLTELDKMFINSVKYYVTI